MSRVAHPAGLRHADVLPAEHPPAPPADLNAIDPAIWPRSARRADGALTLGGIDVRDLRRERAAALRLRKPGPDCAAQPGERFDSCPLCLPRGRFAGFGRLVLGAGTPQRRLRRLMRRSARRLRRDTSCR